MWGTCVDSNPVYLSDYITLAEVVSIKVVKNRNTTVNSSVYEMLIPAQIHMLVVVVRRNMRGVSVWT